MSMCRFQDENDDGYEKFKGVLADFVAGIQSDQRNATKTSLEGQATRRAGQSFVMNMVYLTGLGPV